MSTTAEGGAKSRVIDYKAEPTISRFHRSPATVRGIMGPIGSGKSVGCCMEILHRSMQQKPDVNGVRRTRWAVIRQTYPELKSTTINTWKDWIPESACPITYGAPIEARMKTRLPDKTLLDMHVYFLALDKPRDAKKLLSLELTGAWINEARELDKTIVDAAFSRTGRFPSKRDCSEITWTGLIMDTNPPDDDHWWYRLAEEEKPAGWQFFRQPGALVPIIGDQGRIVRYEANPHAESVRFQQLGYEYWMRLSQGVDPEWVAVHCCGQYGSVFDGKPVYKGSYNDGVHASPTPLGVFRGLPLFLGWDFGLTPACIIGQVTPTGQLRILRELVCKRGGVKQFATNEVKPMLATMFHGMRIVSVGDPAGNQASQADELTCFRQLEALGIPTQAAPTNDFLPRRQSVIDRLSRTIDGHPSILIDPSCKMIRKGFIGGYKFSRVQVTGEERYRDVPSKNAYSHPHDALQYLVLGADTVEAYEFQAAIPLPAATWGGSF
jgi:hypothetical protein